MSPFYHYYQNSSGFAFLFLQIRAGFLFLVIIYTSKVHAYRFEVPHPRMCLWMTDLWKHLDIGPVCREFFAADNGLLNKWLTENNLASYKNIEKVKPKSNSHFFECVLDIRDWSFLDRFLLINALGIKGVNPVFGPSMRQLRDGPLEKLWGGRGIFELQEFFFVIKFFAWILFRPLHEYFLGLIGVHEFFFI